MKTALIILLLACGGCASTAPARWTPASEKVFLGSSFPAAIVEKAKAAIAQHCNDSAALSISRIVPSIVNAGLRGPDEIWTTDVCGPRTWLVTPHGQVQQVPIP